MKNGLKFAAVFIGTVIGAGFATGREIALYFQGVNAFTAAAAGIFLGLLCGFFMLSGKKSGATEFTEYLFKRKKRVFDAVVYICAYITFIAMYSGAKSIFMSTYGLRFVGFLTAVISVLLAVLGLKQIKIINAVLVPLIIAFIAIIFVRNGVFSSGGKVIVIRPVAYAALNIMLGGYVMAEYGREATKKEIVYAAVFSAVALGGMLYMIKAAAGGDLVSEMPLFVVAVNNRAGRFAALLIFFAILTTMVSAAKVMLDGLAPALQDTRLSALVIVATACPPCVLFGFAQIVDSLYPIISVFGILLILLCVLRFLQKKRESTLFD